MASVAKKSGVPFAMYRRQQEFLHSQAYIAGFVGGRGAGKTQIGSYRIISRAKNGRFYLIGAPTYTMLTDVTFRKFNEVAESCNRLVKTSKSKGAMCSVIRTFDANAMPSYGTAEVIFRTASDPDKFRGPNLSGFWMDEASISLEESFNNALAAVREGGELGFAQVSFTPKGRVNWTFSLFYDKLNKPKPYTELFHAESKDNPFLHKDYVAMQTLRMSSRLAEQEMKGLFIDIEGLVFTRDWFKIVDEVPREAYRVRYWDKAASTEEESDATAGVLIARTDPGIYWIEDVVHGRFSSLQREEIMKQTAILDSNRYGGPHAVTIWVEKEGGSGGKESAEFTLRNLAGFDIHIDNMQGQGTKVQRTRGIAAQAEGGNVRIKDANWTADFLDEIVAFPEAKHDDRVDAMSGSFNKLALHAGYNNMADFSVYPPPPDELSQYIADEQAAISEASPLIQWLANPNGR